VADRLADTILADGRARVAARTAQETEHAERRARAVGALRAAVDPDVDPAALAVFARALDVDPAVLEGVLRELLAGPTR